SADRYVPIWGLEKDMAATAARARLQGTRKRAVSFLQLLQGTLARFADNVEHDNAATLPSLSGCYADICIWPAIPPSLNGFLVSGCFVPPTEALHRPFIARPAGKNPPAPPRIFQSCLHQLSFMCYHGSRSPFVRRNAVFY